MLSKNRKLIILAWAMNFLTMSITYNLLNYHDGYIEVNPIMGFFFNIGQPHIGHIIIWGMVFVFYGILYERFINKNKKTIKGLYLPHYVLLTFMSLNVINDLFWYLRANGII